MGQPTGFSDTQIGENWNAAVGLTFSKDGNSMFVWEKGGKVWLVENGQKLATPFLNISEEVGDWKDHGMLGFALDPDFDKNGYVYVLYVVDRHHLLYYGTGSYNPNANEYFNATIGRLTRYTARTSDNKHTVDPASRKILIGETKSTGLPILYTGHGVGDLKFGEDGSLLLSIGDGASAGYVDKGYDPANPNDTYIPQAIQDGIITSKENIGAFRAQQVNCINGKILRVDPATGNGLPSNPFYNSSAPRSPASRVWALGFRNVFRFTIKPGTGGAGFPGIIYAGDVGWYNWEEIDVVKKAGTNFGWPIYEGLTQQEWYYHVQVPDNYDPQNPLYGQNGCTQQYFYYGNLIQQPKKTLPPYFGNPCDYFNTSIPDTYKKFVHQRPAFDWWHKEKGTASRTGIFTGEDADVALLGSASSPVSGPQFTGSSVTGGIWYTGDDFPASYKNTYFFGDYVDGWIRSSKFDAADAPQSVADFINKDAHVVAMASNPVSGGLYYINYAYQLRKVSYNATNSPPKAVATADKLYGKSPLTVQFTGSNSTDPEGKPLTYDWDFGDGSTHAVQANPSHTFSVTGNVVFKVTLKVTDAGGASATATLNISVNNTPPLVNITSPPDGTKYPMSENKVYTLAADVKDQESATTALSYEWQTTLHHNTHTHPEPIDTNPTTTTTITPIGCDGETYFYRISLKVTDPGGLSATDFVDLYPDCSGIITKPIALTSPTEGQTFTAGSAINLSVSFLEVAREWAKVEYYQGTTKIAESTAAPYAATWYNAPGGTYSLKAIGTDKDNHVVASDPVSITVTGAGGGTVTGKISREFWSNVSGYGVTSIPINTTPSSVSEPTLFEAPSNIADNYGTRMRGYVTAPVSGQYTFWIAADNNADLYLSTSEDPAAKVKLAFVNGWTNPREWTKYGTQQSVKVSLQAGKRYYIEALHKEEAGGDNLAVGWQLPDATMERPIPGNRLSPFVISQPPADNKAPVVSISSPANNASFLLGQGLTVTATASDTDGQVTNVEFFANGVKVGQDTSNPYSLSWTPNTAASYTLTAKATDNSGATTTSAPVTILVTASTTKTYQILTLGNSITQGSNTSQSYRYPLWKKLIDANYNFNMVGSQNSNYNGNPSWPNYNNKIFDQDHEGHWGWKVDQLLNGYTTGSTDKLATWLSSYTPDIALLHLGTNDMFYNQSVSETIGEIREVIRLLRQDNPKVALLLAKIIPADLQIVGPQAAENINLLNIEIPKLVSELNTTTSPVILVDQTTGFDPSKGADTYDGVHPNASGEEKMAQKWMGAIQKIITGTTPPPVISHTLTVTTVGSGSVSPAGGTYQEGTSVTLTATAATGFVFSGWSGSVTGTANPVTLVMDANKNVTATFTESGTPPPPTVTGKISREFWSNVSGYGVTSIPVNTTPSSVSEPTLFEAPSNIADNYGTRMRGYVTAPVSGQYTFWIAADNNADLYLSTSEDPAAKVKLAFVNGWTNPREWTKYSTQQSVKVSLQAGKRYYIEALHKEEAGGDNLAVGWQLPDATMERPIPGNRLSPYKGGTAPLPTTYVLSVSVEGSGTVSSSGGSYASGMVVQCTATPASGYVFAGWSGSISSTANPLSLVMDSNKSIKATFTPSTSPPTTTGKITREYWAGLTGYGISSIPLTSTPTSRNELSTFEAPTNIADNYGTRVRGYITAPATGQYTFWIAGDNDVELWLGTSDAVSSRQRIAYMYNGWTNPREWTKYGTQQSIKITLQAGQKYYIEALHKEENGGDNLAVRWQLPDGTLERPVPGNRLSPFLQASTIQALAQYESTSQPDEITVYPNPFKQEITLLVPPETELKSIVLYDLTGRKLFEKVTGLNSENGTLRLVVNQALTKGIYFLRIQDSHDNLKSIKVIRD
ncbi:PA14 domain-containing protein [Pontibacter sp. MBLB2868]|uniref:PA14 domain-containing protein n=1 Tax=Pontibacter sp. MBLB2868 TaxID=3451555 RepID=UPI003F7566F7